MTLQNKIFLLLSLGSTLTATAQTDGYYRLKNKATGEYATLASNVLSYDKVLYDIGASAIAKNKSGARATMIEKMGCYLENDIRLTETPNTTPASVFYIKTQSAKDKTYNLCSEGTDLYAITKGAYTGSNWGNINIGGFYTYLNTVNGGGETFIQCT